MAGLILSPQGCYKIPECEKCNVQMIPQNYQNLNDEIWKCQNCKKIKNLKEKNENI